MCLGYVTAFTLTAISSLCLFLLYATDIFQGQWCPNPRDCFTLNKCIKDEIKEVAESGSRPVFLQYLEDSPVLEETETNDITKCGELREYFEYDKNYPDDDRICNEVRELQVSFIIVHVT